MLDGNMALLSAVAGMLPPGEDRIKQERNAVQSLLASRHGGECRVELFQNTPTAWHGRNEDRAKLTEELQALADVQAG